MARIRLEHGYLDQSRANYAKKVIEITEESSSEYKFKISLFGPGNVGKTSLLLRYVKSLYTEDLKKTIGSNFLIKDVEVGGKQVRLLLWDIGGQPQFHKLRTIYFKGSNGALGVYDLTSPQSLLKIPGWVSSIKKTVKKTIPMILIGPFAGVFIDQYNRKYIMALANFSQAFVIFLILATALFSGMDRVIAIISLAFLNSAFSRFFFPA